MRVVSGTALAAAAAGLFLAGTVACTAADKTEAKVLRGFCVKWQSRSSNVVLSTKPL